MNRLHKPSTTFYIKEEISKFKVVTRYVVRSFMTFMPGDPNMMAPQSLSIPWPCKPRGVVGRPPPSSNHPEVHGQEASWLGVAKAVGFSRQ